MLDAIKLRRYFPVITAAQDVDVGKPDPRGYVLTAKRLSETIGRPLSHERCLVIEDAPIVAERARAAGFAVLGVTTTKPASAWPAGIATVPSLEVANVMGEQ